MPGVYLNAYPLTFAGEMTLWRLGASPDADKFTVRDEVGCSVWQDDAHQWWAARRPPNAEATEDRVRVLPVTSLVLFVLREAILQAAAAAGHQAWISRGEVDVLGLLPAQEEDLFVVEPVLGLRAVREQYIDAHALLQFRQRMRWRVAGDLSEASTRNRAMGGHAVRISGDGPPRARIVAASDSELVLGLGDDEYSVRPEDYALVASSALVANWRGHEVLRRLQIASGTYTISRRRNLYAVKERFRSGADMIRRLGLTIPLPGGATVEVAPRPVEVQMEAR